MAINETLETCFFFHFSKHTTKGHLRIRWIRKPETRSTSRRASPQWLWVCSGRRIQTSPLLCHCLFSDFSKEQLPHRIQNTKTLSFSFFSQKVTFYVAMLLFQTQMKPNFREAKLW